jgi:hypothetical protein
MRASDSLTLASFFVELPEAQPIAKEYLADFDSAAAPLWRQLDLYQSTLFASGGD